MAVIAIATIDNDGVDPGFRAAAAGDWVVPGGSALVSVVIFNGSGGSITATFATAGNIYGQPIPDVPLVVPAGTYRAIKIERAWADPVSGQVVITYTGTLTAAVIVAAVTMG